MQKYLPKIVLASVVVILVATFFALDMEQQFTLENLKRHQEAFQGYYEHNKGLTLVIYFIVYVLITALSLPGAAVMTLAGGAFFGLVAGVVVVSFASSIGATLAFLVSRYLLRASVQNKFGKKLTVINQGIEKDGAFYLLTLRLVPVFPFFVINLLLGLTPIRVWVFYLVSQLGMLPGTAVYVNAGTQLAGIESLQDVLSPALIFSFVLLGVFPLIAKSIVALIKSRRVHAADSRDNSAPEVPDKNEP